MDADLESKKPVTGGAIRHNLWSVAKGPVFIIVTIRGALRVEDQHEDVEETVGDQHRGCSRGGSFPRHDVEAFWTASGKVAAKRRLIFACARSTRPGLQRSWRYVRLQSLHWANREIGAAPGSMPRSWHAIVATVATARFILGLMDFAEGVRLVLVGALTLTFQKERALG
jgi:hypothetical protein